MTVSDGDRRRMSIQARALRSVERDAPAPPDQVAVATAAADEDRRRDGRPSLAARDHLPEEEFHRRARALGLGRRRR